MPIYPPITIVDIHRHDGCKSVHVAANYVNYETFPKTVEYENERTGCTRKPLGFLDPFAVVQVCLPVMELATHRQVKSSKERTGPIQPEYCEAIRVYLEDWPEDEEIEAAVQHYIQSPCQQKLQAVIGRSCTRAIGFLTSYLRARGPLIQWETPFGAASINGRCLNTLFAARLKQLPDLEFLTVVFIGRYLQYLTNVAYSHGLFYFRTLVAKVWGPLLLRLVYRNPLRREEVQRIELSISLFSRIIDSANWYAFELFDGVHKIMKTPCRMGLKHSDYEKLITHGPDNTCPRVPGELTGTMSDVMKRKAIEFALKECPIPKSEQVLCNNEEPIRADAWQTPRCNHA